MSGGADGSFAGDAVGPTGRTRLGPTVRARRVQINLSLAELAARVGCAKSYLSAIENEKRGAPGEELLEKIEGALMLPRGKLVDAARWQRSIEAGGPSVRDELARQDVRVRAAERLAAILSRRARADGAGRAIDEASRLAELRRLMETISPGISSGGAGAGTRGAHGGAGLGGVGLGGVGVGGATPVVLPMQVPLINSVAAGYPREFTDLDFPARVADEYVSCPDLHDPDAFAARVVGDSMMPTYAEGDIVIFSPMRDVKNGSDCFARLEPDHESTFKRVYFETSAGGEELIRLQPLNSSYAPRIVGRERVAGLYAAVSVLRRIV